jgi:hypothetical protein
MSKKTKKAKTPKPGKGGGNGGGGKDPVTGLNLAIDGKQFISSDEVYSQDSASYQSFWQKAASDIKTAALDTAAGQLEYELGNSFIVWTYSYKQADGQSATGRQVLEGNFTYNKGKLSGGQISRALSYTLNPDGDGQRTGIYSTSKGMSIKAGNSLDSITNGYYSSFTAGTPYLFSYESDTTAIAVPSDIYQDSTIARFFPQGWWQDPFTPNLI